MSKISHFIAIGILVGTGYFLSLGVEGRAQVAGLTEVVADGIEDVSVKAERLSEDLATLASNLSFSNVYSAFGILTGAMPEIGPSSAAQVSSGLVVTEQEAAVSAIEEVERIKNAFSDTVKVRPDASKKSGTITPVFKGVEGQNYTYVIVPVKK